MPNSASVPETKSAVFLSHLAHELTVCARSAYEPGTENLLEPRVLRAYNELLHRVTGSLRDHLMGQSGMPVADVIELIRRFGVEFNRTSEANWALKRALDSVS